MDPRDSLEEDLKKWVENHEKNGIRQHSDEWHKVRINTIGGSSLATIQGNNPYSSVIKIIREKIGFAEFVSDIKPQWGNAFEDVIKRIVEHQRDCVVHGEDMFVLGAAGTSYSPDGLAVMDIMDSQLVAEMNHPEESKSVVIIEKKVFTVVLLEFKCPFSRIPNGIVPKYYIPQVKMGLDLLNYPTIGLFVEAVFRRCAWEDLGNNPKYDTTLVKASSGSMPIAFGILGFYISEGENSDKKERMIKEYIEHYVEYGDKTNDFMANDLGSSPSDLFKMIMNLYDKKAINLWYGDIVYPNESNHECRLNADLEKFVQFCASGQFINLGILPWKLFRIDYHYVQKEPNYLQPWMEKIREVVDVISQCNDPANSDKKYNIFASYMEEHNQ